MTKQEFDEMAALVVRLRKDVELHTDALRQSNAQCGKLLVQNEQLQSRLADESRKNERGLAEAEKQVAFYRMAADTLDRLLEIILEYGADESDDIAGFIERLASERNTLKRELVEVRAALAATTEQRDSLQRTLDEWERADTTPHERVTADDVADHVVPPVLPLCNLCHGCGGVLLPSGQGDRCINQLCARTYARTLDVAINPKHGPCTSSTPVRHE